MTPERFVFRSTMPVSADEVFRWHARPGAFERLTPPWEKVRMLERRGGIEDGAEAVIEMRAGGRRRRWVARHHGNAPGRQFCDTQVEGPFARWEHCHRFLPGGPSQSWLEDDVEYALPLGRLGNWLGGAFVRKKLQRLFCFRHQVTARDLTLHQKYAGDRPLKILVTGSSGLIGSALVPFLTSGGHKVVRLVRKPEQSGADVVCWDPAAGLLDAAQLEGLDAVVHLAGENIAGRRWSVAQKARIRDSRVESTQILCQALGRLRRPPRVLVAASAIGYYGSRDDSCMDETSRAGTGFLAEVCREWEAATKSATASDCRVVNLRFGVVLSPAGGALASMLTPFRLGLGGRIGSGRQFMSWIAVEDVLGAIYHALATPGIEGPVNAIAPNPVTNREFTKTLGRVLSRPTIFPMPAFAARLAFGEMANELLLASTRVVPQALLGTGYQFLFPMLEPSLRYLIGREGTSPQGELAKQDQPQEDAVLERRGEECVIR